MKRLQYLFTLIFLFAAITAGAQVNLRPGYIIDNRNDTIYGTIDFRTAERNAHICDFYPAGSTQKTTYEPGSIYAYRFTDDGKFYITRKVTLYNTPQTLFLEYLVKGTISLYYYKDDEPHYFFENENGAMLEAAIEEVESKDEQGKTGILTRKPYIGIMTYLFQDSEKVRNKVPTLTFTKGSLIKITKEYHYETCRTGEQCIEFENKPDSRFFHYDFTLSAGIVQHTFTGSSKSYIVNIGAMKSASPSMLGGVVVTVPRIGTTIGMQAEVELSKLAVKGELPRANYYTRVEIDAWLTDFRCGLQLNPFKGKVQPLIEGGAVFTHLWGTDALVTEQNFLGSSIKEVKQDLTGDLYDDYFGYYAGAGLLIKLNKTAFSLRGRYESRTVWQEKLTSWSGSIGYIF